MSSSKPHASIAETSEGVDFISELPDCILTSIVFLLPLKESVRTGILSSRWREIWKLAPLCLDDSPSASSPLYPHDDTISLDPWKWNETPGLIPLSSQQMSFFVPQGSFLNPQAYSVYNPLDQPINSRFSRLLSAHKGPVHSLQLSGVKGLVFRKTVDHLVNTVIKRGIREISLKFDFPKIYGYRYQLPLSLFECESLQILTLRQCLFPVPAPNYVFPNLKELNLMQCSELNIDWLETVLQSCVSLETLQLVSCYASRGSSCGALTISSTSLRNLVITESYLLGITELIIEASNLENLMLCKQTATDCNVRVRHKTKLQVLGFIRAEFNKLQIDCDYFVQQKSTESAPAIDLNLMPPREPLSTVKTLAIDVRSIRNYCSNLAVLFGSVSCLENLYINYCTGRDYVKPVFWNKQGSFAFLEYHLKQVIVNGFRFDGYTNELSYLDFMRFLVLNGKVLQKIVILLPINTHARTDEKKIRKGICFDKRASKNLELIFTEETRCREHVSMWSPLLNKDFVAFP